MRQHISYSILPRGSCCAFILHETSFPNLDADRHRVEAVAVGVAEDQDTLQLRPYRRRARQLHHQLSSHLFAGLLAHHFLLAIMRTPSRPTHLCVGDNKHHTISWHALTFLASKGANFFPHRGSIACRCPPWPGVVHYPFAEFPCNLPITPKLATRRLTIFLTGSLSLSLSHFLLAIGARRQNSLTRAGEDACKLVWPRTIPIGVSVSRRPLGPC